MKPLQKLLLILLLAAYMVLSGCASGMRAVQNKDLAVEAKMSETIFLDAETLTSNPAIFVRVANTSDFQDIDFGDLVRQQLSGMGYQITGNAREAQYHVTANLLYMGESKEGMNPEAVLASGFGGALLGASVAGVSGSNLRGAGAAGLIAGVAVAGGEALVGQMFKVNEYFGVVDLQVKEEVEGGVTGTQEASVRDGSSTTTQTTRNIQEKRQEYRTRIVVKARQTNMDRNEAVTVITERLSGQVSGMFKL